MSDGKGKCMKENALYRIKCGECKKVGIDSDYWGETGRNCYVKGGEHLKGLKEKRYDKAMWKHRIEKHQGGEEMFEMKVEKTFVKPLARQIRE